VLLLVACGASLWPRAFRVAAPLAVCGLIVHQSLIRGFTHLNHAQIALLLVAGVLALFANLPERGAGRAYNRYAVPLVASALVLTLSYSLIGFYRLSTGMAIFTGDSIVNYVVSRSLRTSYYDFNVGIAAVSWTPIALALRAGFPLVTIVEALAPLALVSRAFRWLFLAVMIPFHFLTLVLMEVSFIENLLLYVVLLDISHLFARQAVPAGAGRAAPGGELLAGGGAAP
jgi:hypothetical protein